MKNRELVWRNLEYRGPRIQGTTYTPEPRFARVNKQQVEYDYLQHISAPVKHIVAAAYNARRNELVDVFEPGSEQLRSMYEQVQALWESSERRKAWLLEQKRLENAQNDPRLPLGTQHRKNGSKVTLYAVNAQKLIKDLNQIHRIIEASFQPKQKLPVDQCLERRVQYKSQAQLV